MSSMQSTIKCPNYGTQINIEDALYFQLQTKFDIDREAERKRYKEAMDALRNDQSTLESQKLEFDKKIQGKVEQQLSLERVKLQAAISRDIKAKVDAENALQVKQLQEELDSKSKQLQELNASKATIAKLTREKDEMESRIKAESALELNKQLEIEKEKAIKLAGESSALKLREKDEQLEQIKKQLDDAKRKAE